MFSEASSDLKLVITALVSVSGVLFLGVLVKYRHKICTSLRYLGNGFRNYFQLCGALFNCPIAEDPEALLYLHREGKLFSCDMADRPFYARDIVAVYDSPGDSINTAEAERLLNGAQVRRKITTPKKTTGNLRYGAALSTNTLAECGDLNEARFLSEGAYEPERAVYRLESTQMPQENWGTQEYMNVIETPESSPVPSDTEVVNYLSQFLSYSGGKNGD